MTNTTKNRRKRDKYPSLKRRFNLKIRQEFIETEEYMNGVTNSRNESVIRPLNDEELAWLNKFNAEVETNSFKNDGNDFYSKKNRKELNCQNNARNRDIFAQLKCRNLLLNFDIEQYDSFTSQKLSHIDFESMLIAELEKEDAPDESK